MKLNDARCWAVWSVDFERIAFVSIDRNDCRYFIGLLPKDFQSAHMIIRMDLAECYRVK